MNEKQSWCKYGGKDNNWKLTFLNCQNNILVKPNIDIRTTSNIPIFISPLGSPMYLKNK